MSDTPRTDANTFKILSGITHYREVTDSEFARDLERELAEAKAKIGRLEREIGGMRLKDLAHKHQHDRNAPQKSNHPEPENGSEPCGGTDVGNR